MIEEEKKAVRQTEAEVKDEWRSGVLLVSAVATVFHVIVAAGVLISSLSMLSAGLTLVAAVFTNIHAYRRSSKGAAAWTVMLLLASLLLAPTGISMFSPFLLLAILCDLAGIVSVGDRELEVAEQKKEAEARLIRKQMRKEAGEVDDDENEVEDEARKSKEIKRFPVLHMAYAALIAHTGLIAFYFITAPMMSWIFMPHVIVLPFILYASHRAYKRNSRNGAILTTVCLPLSFSYAFPFVFLFGWFLIPATILSAIGVWVLGQHEKEERAKRKEEEK